MKVWAGLLAWPFVWPWAVHAPHPTPRPIPAAQRPALPGPSVTPAIAPTPTPLASTPAAAPSIAAAPLTRAPAPFTLQGWQAELVLRPRERRCSAVARFRVANPGGLPAIVRFRLAPGLGVSRVNFDGRPLRFTRETPSLLAVKLPPSKRSGVVSVLYAGRPLQTSGTSRRQDIDRDVAVLAADGDWLPRPAHLAAIGAPGELQLELPGPWRSFTSAARAVPTNGRWKLHFDRGVAPAILAGAFVAHAHAGGELFVRASQAGTSAYQRLRGLWAPFAAHGLNEPTVGSARGFIELAADWQPFAIGAWQAGPLDASGLARAWWTRTGASESEHQFLEVALANYAADLQLERERGRDAYERAVQAHLASYRSALLGVGAAADTPFDRPLPAEAPALRHKGPLIWAMLRDALGEKDFWALLQARRTAIASGHGSLEAFLAEAGARGAFVSDWLSSPGLPSPRLREVTIRESAGRYVVAGRVAQPGAGFRLPLELAIESIEGTERATIQLAGPSTPFRFECASAPLRVAVDPADRAPIAHAGTWSIARAVADPLALIVYGTRGTPDEARACLEAARGLRAAIARDDHHDLPLRADTALAAAERERTLLLVGGPNLNALGEAFASQFPVRVADAQALWWQGRTYSGSACGVVQAIANPQNPDCAVVLFAGLGNASLAKAPAYAHQASTFCLFEGDRPIEAQTLAGTFPDLDAVLY